MPEELLMHFEISPTLENLQLSEATSQDVFVACLLQQVPDLWQIFLDIAEKKHKWEKGQEPPAKPQSFSSETQSVWNQSYWNEWLVSAIHCTTCIALPHYFDLNWDHLHFYFFRSGMN